MKVKKKSLAMIITLLTILSFNSNIQSFSLTDQSNQSYTLSVKITNLKAYTHSWIIDFFATIKIFNPSNLSIKLNQPNSCGFDLSINAYTDYGFMGQPPESVCSHGKNLFPTTYGPGTTTELYNGSVSLLSTSTNTPNLSPGFYFFDIEISNQYYTNIVSSDPNYFQTINALYVYYGGGKSSIQYNETSPDTLPYGTLPISKQLSLFAESAPFSVSTTTATTSLNNTNMTPILKVINFMFNNAIGIIFITSVFVVSVLVFSNFRKKHPFNNRHLSLNNTSNPYRNLPNKTIYLSGSQSNQTKSDESYGRTCVHCHKPLQKDSIFCAHCGLKIL